MRYKILKILDVSGLTFLSPVVRLCTGEEPAVQLKKIGQLIVIPILAIIVFIIVWFQVSDRIHTKSGKLPNPTETLQSLSAINTFAAREEDKKAAFNLTGPQRERLLHDVQIQLAALEPSISTSDEAVTAAKADHQADLASQVAPLQEHYDRLKARFTNDQSRRKAALAAAAEQLADTNAAGHNALLLAVKDDLTHTDREKEELSTLKSAITELNATKSPAVAEALRQQSLVAEEKQYLEKMVDQLTSANRSLKVAEAEGKISADLEAYTALTGPEALAKARSIAKAESRVETIATSDYAQPATLWFQVRRSILCVFLGFLIGTAIAIPIGILCGLSPTFMAAMMPFIAIFKPVSPIVWLPIALIIVGGFIPDPDKNPLVQWLWDLPLLGVYQINPAFIASAITVALCSLWATLVNTALGVASIDKDHVNVARVLKLGFLSRLIKIVIPSALPLIFTGLRISLGVGWMVLIAAELLSSSEGLGKFVWDQFNNGASDSFAKMVVVVFVVGVIGLLLDRIMIVFQRLVSFDGAPAAI